MAKFELKLPKMGESVAEATVTNWLKKVGDENAQRAHLRERMLIQIYERFEIELEKTFFGFKFDLGKRQEGEEED